MMIKAKLTTARITRLRRVLLQWYGQHRRQLPWRATDSRGRVDPYHVLVSEAMLQQTQVVTVVDYFNRFVDRLPTVRALATADEQVVLRLWQGLGYYRRAQHLHAAAKMIVDEFDARVPSSVDQLMRLAGIGQYSAGAIASIAYGRASPILDGNVARVLARWLAIEQSIDAPKVRDRLWQVAQQLVPPSRPGDFNQALMELGQLVCTPKRPQCKTCPVANQCRAYKDDSANRLPLRTPRRAPQQVFHHIVAIHRGDKYLLEQRGAKGLWSQMWQIPTAEQASASQLTQWVKDHFGLTVTRPRKVKTFGHQTSHRTIKFVLWCSCVQAGRLRRGSGLWRRLDAMDDLPFANPQHRALKLLHDAVQTP